MKSIINLEENPENLSNTQQSSECLKRKKTSNVDEENYSNSNENCKKQKIINEIEYSEEKDVELKKILNSESSLTYGQSSQFCLENNKIEECSFPEDALSNASEAELSENVTELILKEVEKSSKETEKPAKESEKSFEESKDSKDKNNMTEISGKDTNASDNTATSSNGDSKRAMNIRKNIRDVISDTSLDPMTLNAQKQESERLARLQEQQKIIRAQNIRAYQLHLQQQQQQQHQSRQQHFNQQSAPPPYYYPPYQGSSSANSNANNYNGSHPPSHQSFYPPKHADGYYGSKYNYDMYQKHRIPKPVPTSSSEIVTISDDEDDDDDDADEDEEIDEDDKKSSSSDDCIILSDTDELDEVEDGDDDANNSGMHVNDVYNISDEQGRVLVNSGHPDNEPDIFLANQIACAIKPHQIGGIRFLYDNIIESVERFKTSTGFGCILAHSMGLGKTLQLVSFCDIFLRHTSSKTVLCIMPINTLQNWLAEFDRWLPSEENNKSDEIRPRHFKIFVLNDQFKTLSARAKVIMEWAKVGGVLLIGYELFRLLTLKMNKKNKKDKHKLKTIEENRDENAKLYNEVYDVLLKPGPDLVICDEGHRIKNSHASVSIALKQIGTKRRIVLTGYPLQNNLLEYWCMIDFVRPNYLGTKTEFSNMFERPIQNGQCIDSTPEDKKLMRYRSHVLHSLLLGFVQRRSSFVLESTLPKKEEYIILLRMSKAQRLLYDTFMNEVVRKKTVPNPLKAFAVCCKIWNHPDVLYNFLKNRDMDDLDLLEATGELNKKSTKLKSINNKNFTTNLDFQSPSLQREKDVYDPYLRESSSIYPIYQPSIPQNLNAFNRLPECSEILDLDAQEIKHNNNENKNELPISKINFPKDDTVSYTWAKDLLRSYCTDMVENSPKMVVFFHLLEETVKMTDRILVFSQSLLTLNIIEAFLSKRYVPESNDKWKKNLNYFRLDGSTPPIEREKLINEFNRNSNIHLFLVSTKAGSLGINLVGANRVIVFDASWNPCHDAQAICRVYRYGQQKPCFIYRFVMDNCLEKKIYDRQVNKQGIAHRIVDECNPDAHLLLKEITNLCFDDVADNKQIDPEICKSKYSDILIQKMIEFYSDHLSKEPFFHESLLVDRKEKKLSVAEKRLAQRSYEIEKRASAKSHLGYGNMMMNYSPQNNTNGNGNNKFNIINNRYFENRNEPELNVPSGQYEKFGARPTRWIPAEIWQRQGMSAQEMILPSDVSIPTNGSQSNIILKAGQKVMVLKSLKGVYMQLESGKIIAIKTPLKTNSGNNDRNYVNYGSRNQMNNIAQKTQNSINHIEEIEIQDLTEDDPEIIQDKNLSNNSSSSTEIHSNKLIEPQPVLNELGINFESQESSSSSYTNNINDNISYF